ncbi:hypothetical protein AB1Y20_020514 [Prymnesium parvum]|uniref:Protein kinase domain-containing protein n=1 Tax=Prymnesium parvum TaxID=97485 RepID=A0AB34JVC6_PRYPA
MAPLPAEMLFIDTSGRGGATTAGRDPSVRVFEDEYELGDELGRGAFGVVYTAYAKRSGEAYAVKCMHKKKLMQLSSNSLVRVKDEIRALTALQHPHIIRMHATFESEDQLHILMEKADGGELFDRIVACGAFEEEHARHVAYQLLDVLHFMHTRAVLHRDIKPENLLLTSETSWDIKVTDFGLIKILDEHLFSAEELDANDAHHGDRRATVCGSNTYMAPEMAWHMAYGPALDVYSAGVVIYILLSGGPPYDVGQTPHPASTQSIPLPAQLFGTVSADAKELLKCMLEPSPSRRVTAAAALSSRWFSDHAVKTNDAGTGVQESVRGASTSDEGDLLDMAELQEWIGLRFGGLASANGWQHIKRCWGHDQRR